MGYSGGMVRYIASLIEKSAVRPASRVLEFGAQIINKCCETTDVEHFLAAIRRQGGASDVGDNEAFRGKLSGYLYEAAGFKYTSVDAFEGPFVYLLDINETPIPVDFRGRFDFITNVGTSEHIINQLGFFRAAHDAAAVGCCMLHQVPFSGYVNHGFFNYQPRFFEQMATANAYDLVDFFVTGQHGANTLRGWKHNLGNAGIWGPELLQSGLITVVYQKRIDRPFMPPLDIWEAPKT